jgi:hypothetical protein
MPDPRSEAVCHWRPAAKVIEILKRTRGRAFVLFTSYATMRAVQAIAEMALDYPILSQGTAPRSQLLNQFRTTPHAVLFATSSFWQGVDVVGRGAQLRDRGQAAVRVADRPGDGGSRGRHSRARRRSIRRVPGAAGDSRLAARAGPPHPSSAGPRCPRLCWIRDSGPKGTVPGLSRRCLPAPVVHELSDVDAFFSV